MALRSVISRVAAGGIGLCIGLYLAAAQITSKWWPGNGVWLLAAVAVVLGLIWLAVELGVTLRGPRPVMRMTLAVGNTWEVENLTRKPLLDARYIGVGPDGMNLAPKYRELGMPDFEGRGKTDIGSLPPGGYVAFHWIKDDLRRSARVRIRDGIETMDVTPDPLPKRRRHRA